MSEGGREGGSEGVSESEPAYLDVIRVDSDSNEDVHD